MTSVQITGGVPTPEKVHAAFLVAAERRFRKAMADAEGEIRRRAPIRTGHLRRSITSTVRRTGTTFTGIVGSNLRYARYQDEGTGIYGPRHTPIVPVRARALRFPAGGRAGRLQGGVRAAGTGGRGFTLAGRQRSGSAGANAQYVFARSVRGTPALHYFEEGLRIARPKVQKELRAIAADARHQLGMGGARA